MTDVKILVTIPEIEGHPQFVTEIAAVSPQLEVMYQEMTDPHQVSALLSGVEVFYGCGAPLHLKRADRLRWVALHYSGMESDISSPVFDEQRGIIVTNVAGAHAVPIAEYTITVMVMLHRNFMQLVRDKLS